MSFRRLWIGPFVLVVVTIHSHSVAVKNLHIDDLVRASDVIAIAEVANVREIGHAPPVLFDDQLLEADFYSADLQVKKIIKGVGGGPSYREVRSSAAFCRLSRIPTWD